MKKILIFAILLIFCFCLTACDPATYYFELDDLLENIIGIDLINYSNTEQKHFLSWVPDHSSKLVPLRLENLTIIETLENENIPNFLEQLSKVNFLDKYYAFNSPKDICIRLVYSNSDFLILSCAYERKAYVGYVGRFDCNGNVVNFIGSFESLSDFISLVNNFFETQILV